MSTPNLNIQEDNLSKKDLKKVTGSPTKEFFITMLTRDISLRDAIGDLVDNSIDGARRLTQNSDYTAFNIDINISEKEFSIQDNCGGIDIEVARNYAFRFGRSPEYEGSPYSIGQFGIGMKRALFKIAKKIEIHSKSATSAFSLKVNVDEWAVNQDLWDFYFEDGYEDKTQIDERDRGTKIIVSELSKEAENEFKDSIFLKKLQLELEKENMYPIYKGLNINLNTYPLAKKDMGFVISDEIKPGYEKRIEKIGQGEITIKIFAGISDSNLLDGGWYIFCNERMILGPEQSSITGWTGRDSDGGPVYHNQYDRFRGYVFFEAKNASLLPWNTTKNGVDIDSPVFKNVRQRMILMMKPIITFLNNLKREKEGDSQQSDWFLENKIEAGKSISIQSVDNSVVKYTESTFKAPSPPPKTKSTESFTKITYSKPKNQVDKVKAILNIKDNKEVGESTFDYFYNNEVDE